MCVNSDADVNYRQVKCRMLLGVVSLTTGSTTGVPMSPGYGGCQTATPLPCYTTTYATTGSYTTKAQECYTAIHDASSCYTESRSITLPRVTSPKSRITITEVPKYYITEAADYYTYRHATPDYYTEAYKTEALKYCPSCYTYVPKYYCA